MRVLIIGGGFGGIETAKKLGREKGFEVLLLDRRNYHLFQPLLYQVATAGLSPAEIAAPIRGILSDYENVRVVLDEVTEIATTQQKVTTKKGKEYSYDVLVLAAGANHSYFGHPEWETFSPGLKTLEQATEIRRRILTAFENAETESDSEKRKSFLTFVIVGGGPTGVELAGSIAEISRKTLESDFRNIDPSSARVILIEASPRVLGSFEPELSKKATRDLEAMGVQVWTHTRVTDITQDGVQLQREFISATTVLWAAGVKPSPLGEFFKSSVDAQGRVRLTPELLIEGESRVFAIGDMASFKNPETQLPLPGLAPVAIQQGRWVAKNIKKLRDQKPLETFTYLDKGQMATIGRRRAVLQYKDFRTAGFFAWLIWLVIHIYYLIGFKNRFFVFFQWSWSYLTFSRGARLIVEKDWKQN